MNTQPKALRIAADLEYDHDIQDSSGSLLEGAAELRRLHSVNAELLGALKEMLDAFNTATNSGDWKIDGACDPDATIKKAHFAIAKAQE